jgi:predicted transcriptional regulator
MENQAETTRSVLPQVPFATMLCHMDVIATIDRILSERGMRRMDLATLLGWSQSKLSKTLGSPEKMTLEEVRLIAQALKVRPSVLTADEADRQPALTEMERELLKTIRNVGVSDVLTTLIASGVSAGKSQESDDVARHAQNDVQPQGGRLVKRDARKGRRIVQPSNGGKVSRADIIVEGPELDEPKQRGRKRG